jgi:hypothetical protein
LQPVRFEKYRLEFVGKVATKRKHIDLLAFISALDTIATIGNIHSRTLVASIQPCGPAINIDIDADVYQNVRETIYDILMADFF